MSGITSIAGYLPRLRLSRRAIAEATQWANPAASGMGKGQRTICGPDEDSITMAVEAGRACLAAQPDADPLVLQFASTTAPFADRGNAVLAGEALALPLQLRCADFGGSLGAGMSALMNALSLDEPVLTVAAERRMAPAASAQEMALGHGAAAVMTGGGDPIAACLAVHAAYDDFVDHYRAADATFDYSQEERWVRDEGQTRQMPEAIRALLEKAGCGIRDIAHLVLGGVSPAAARQVAKELAVHDGQLADLLDTDCGNTGSAHPLLMLTDVIERASPGEKILIAMFAQGVQCILLETTPALAGWSAPAPIAAQRASGRVEDNYVRYLSFSDLVQIDWGVRTERDNRTALSAFNRHRKAVTGFVGGKCTQCGNRQFPKGQACVNPQCRAFGTLEDEPFRDKVGRIRSFTEDWLAISPNPPLMYGNVTFADGGVVTMEFADCEPGELSVGQEVRFVFRIKDKDPKRQFRRYFWKAVPVDGAQH